MRSCAKLFGVYILVVILVAVLGSAYTSYKVNNPDPTATPHPFPITRHCINETAPRTQIALLMRQLVGTDDVGVILGGTVRPIGAKTIQEHKIQFSAYKKGTGKYKKGWLSVYLRDSDCSIVDYRLDW